MTVTAELGYESGELDSKTVSFFTASYLSLGRTRQGACLLHDSVMKGKVSGVNLDETISAQVFTRSRTMRRKDRAREAALTVQNGGTCLTEGSAPQAWKPAGDRVLQRRGRERASVWGLRVL